LHDSVNLYREGKWEILLPPFFFILAFPLFFFFSFLFATLPHVPFCQSNYLWSKRGEITDSFPSFFPLFFFSAHFSPPLLADVGGACKPSEVRAGAATFFLFFRFFSSSTYKVPLFSPPHVAPPGSARINKEKNGKYCGFSLLFHPFFCVFPFFPCLTFPFLVPQEKLVVDKVLRSGGSSTSEILFSPPDLPRRRRAKNTPFKNFFSPPSPSPSPARPRDAELKRKIRLCNGPMLSFSSPVHVPGFSLFFSPVSSAHFNKIAATHLALPFPLPPPPPPFCVVFFFRPLFSPEQRAGPAGPFPLLEKGD